MLGPRPGLLCLWKSELLRVTNWGCYQTSAWEQSNRGWTLPGQWNDLVQGEKALVALGPSGLACRHLGLKSGREHIRKQKDSTDTIQQEPPCPWWVVRAASNQGKYGSSGSPNVLLDHLVSLDECCFRDSSCLDPSGDFVDGGLLTSCYLEVPAVAEVRGDSWSLFILQDGFLRVCQWYPNFRRSHLFI